MRFAGKTVVVTGAAGAVGSACVEAFLREGARVLALDAQETLIDSAVPVVVDLTSETEIDRTFAWIEEQWGGVDVLVQSAALFGRRPFLELSGADIDSVLNVNVRATLLCARAAASIMVSHASAGVIVNLGSVAAHFSDAASIAYDASKGAVSAASRGMAVALAQHRIRVVEVAPGPMAKPQGKPERPTEDLDDYALRRIPLARWGTPTDVVEAVLFAASDAASYLTGTTIHVDGGVLASW